MSGFRGDTKKDAYSRCFCPSSPPRKKSCASGIIEDIMKKYFCQKAGQGSSCSLFSDPRGSQYSMDRRLLYWTQILEDRKKIACRIQKVTGKRYSHVLYNQLEEHRNIQNVKRIMDYAQRLNPTKLSTRQRLHLPDSELYETLPRSEQKKLADNLEIVGSPKVIQAEQCIRPCCDSSTNQYLTSEFLKKKIAVKKRDLDMDNVLDFYPEIDGLQVVGNRIHKHDRPAGERISDFELSRMSSDSELGSYAAAEFPEYCIQINNIILRSDVKSNKSLIFQLHFKCKPFERQTQALCKLKNIGRKPVNLIWRRIIPRDSAYFPPRKTAFAFSRRAFRLTYSESEEIEIFFTPTERMIREEQWCLKTEPDFFDEENNIFLYLTGECYIPEDYYGNIVWDLLDILLCGILPGGDCSTRRRVVLSEKELFENNNPGFKCEPGDLRRFKEIYRQVRKKCHPSVWDMNLQTLKEIIEGIEDFTQRSMYLEVFMKIIREMKRRMPNCESNIKVLLARSLIVAILDQWEVKAAQIVNSVARTDVDILLIKMPFEHVIVQINEAKSEQEKRAIIQYNALYIQMYCSLCDLAENIVSFVENCLLLYDY